MTAAPRVFTLQVGSGWHAAQPGGLERVFHELTSRLPRAGVDVQGLVAGDDRVVLESEGAVRSFAPTEASMFSRFFAVRRAARATLAEHPQALLVSHFAPYGLAIVGLGEGRLVVHFHGPWSGESRAEGHGALSFALRRAIERFVYRRADACVVLSQAFGELLQRDFGVSPHRIHVIPGGVALERFAALPTREAARTALGWTQGRPTVLALRRLVRRTGVDRLIDAVPALKERVPDVQVMVAGEGIQADALADRARGLGLDGVVRFLGRLSEEQLPLAYRAADLTIVPSVALEGFGLIVPESLAAGTPVMVTPVGGLPETVEALSPAMILRDASPAAIAEGLSGALTGSLALPDAQRCAAFARAHYDWDLVTSRIATLYRSIA